MLIVADDAEAALDLPSGQGLKDTVLVQEPVELLVGSRSRRSRHLS
jgi:hypothetical protein